VTRSPLLGCPIGFLRRQDRTRAAADDLQHRERIGSLKVSDAPARVAHLSRRFEQLHGARRWAYVLLALLTAAAVLAALVFRTPFAGRFCVAIAPALRIRVASPTDVPPNFIT